MTTIGIDYGLGTTNIDKTTGIRFGVISQHSIMPECFDYFEQDYGTPHCPECGNNVNGTNEDGDFDNIDADNYQSHGCNDYYCETCNHYLDSSVVFSEESLGQSYDRDGYQITDCLDSDLFILKSPYYTFAQFCSPCVPGAGNLDNPMPEGIKTYCLGHDWFEDGKAPYPVYSVADDSEVIGN